MSSFGKTIRELRKQRGLTQKELAGKVGINFTYLSKIENDLMPPPRQPTIRKIADVLEADADELVLLAGKIPPDLATVVVEKAMEQLLYLRSLEGDLKGAKDWRALFSQRRRAGR